MIKIALTKGYCTLVDDEDYIWLNAISWHTKFDSCGTKYAQCGYTLEETGPKIYWITMHRMIYLKYHPNEIINKVDHIDGDGLNNQKDNLRSVTDYQSVLNRGVSKNNKLGIKGVWKHTKNNTWIAQITMHGLKIYLGSFYNLEDAVIARKTAEIKYHGEFARK